MPRILLIVFLCGVSGISMAEDISKAAYLPPGTADVNHLCLIYHGQERRVNWTAENLRPYVACLDKDEKPTDWLFDSFLFIEFATDSGKSLYHYAPSGGHCGRRLPELSPLLLTENSVTALTTASLAGVVSVQT